MNKTLRIFSHKGIVGAESDMDNGEFLNNPHGDGQIGCVVSVDNCVITSDAKSIISKCSREGGSFSSLMLTLHDESIKDKSGAGSVGVLGFHCHMLGNGDKMIGRLCEKSVLDLIDVDDDMNIPKDFIDACEES